jgi:AraC-like DNA-binding protein
MEPQPSPGIRQNPARADGALAFLSELRVVSSPETGHPPALRAVPMGAGAGLTIEGGSRVLERRVVAGDHTSRIVKLLLQRRGQALLSHSGRQAELVQGDLAFIDGAHDFRLDMPGPSDQSVIVLPRDLVARRHEGLLGRVGRTLSGDDPTHRMVFEALHAIIRHAERLTPEARNRSMAATVDLIGALKFLARRGSGPDRRFEVALADIDAHLADPDLTAAAVAARQGISRRRLDAIFRERGSSPERIIWDRRLRRIAEELSAPRVGRHRLLDLALAWGFSSEAHFSRAFRRKFGEGPRAFRQRAHPGER